jgi:hypothetical protein
MDRKVSPEIYPGVRIARERSSFTSSLSFFLFSRSNFSINKDLDGHDQSSVGSSRGFDSRRRMSSRIAIMGTVSVSSNNSGLKETSGNKKGQPT